ncbi:bacteriophage antitermination protein Q, partial [Enterobacter kobei]|uniref:bacteriophage antitermination protein Q n=1 Tax=Enterobacter kobei TaxID=208224 RepID=UPI0006525EE7
LHGDVLMWLMKTLLTSGCTNQRGAGHRVTKKLIGLVWLAAQEVAASRNNDTYQEYAGAALARMVSVERSTWLRVYSGHWAAFKASFAEMDSQALSEILTRYEEYQELKVAEM